MRGRRGLLIAAAIGISAGIVLATGVWVTASAAKGVDQGVAGGPGTVRGVAPAVTREVGPAAQRAAVTFWTVGRMEQAAAAGTRAASSPVLPAGTRRTAVPATAVAPKGIPSATKFTGVPTVGALFYTTGTQKHFCTASVTDSQPGDLILTSAHCVYTTSDAQNIAYVPKYHNGLQPYGIWPVKAIVVPTRWVTAHDPNWDFAFLTLATVGNKEIQAVTKGLTLRLNGSYAETIEVIGYNDTDDEPVHCLTRSFEFRAGQQEFYCHGFWMGTSGGPWINLYDATTGTGVVHGVIGGYEEGGQYEWASYSCYFGLPMESVYAQAERAG